MVLARRSGFILLCSFFFRTKDGGERAKQKEKYGERGRAGICILMLREYVLYLIHRSKHYSVVVAVAAQAQLFSVR